MPGGCYDQLRSPVRLAVNTPPPCGRLGNGSNSPTPICIRSRSRGASRGHKDQPSGRVCLPCDPPPHIPGSRRSSASSGRWSCSPPTSARSPSMVCPPTGAWSNTPFECRLQAHVLVLNGSWSRAHRGRDNTIKITTHCPICTENPVFKKGV